MSSNLLLLLLFVKLDQVEAIARAVFVQVEEKRIGGEVGILYPIVKFEVNCTKMIWCLSEISYGILKRRKRY